ncbi:hypothetical protein Q9299_18710 [Gemmobacter fulvus]|uniref:hypothetical protein n=1 Tax=Gemmobacter fulvus TaxID=2840474 RepID=UPI002796C623|nr:hypothetical protein [Gemmobacter fulvus]MDQ1850338.1 hypothetical protein [Gemmobacter fulvus]
MTMEPSVIRQGLETIGMGPVRLSCALEGAELFGSAGLLNSLELVQFITALCELTRIDVEDFIHGGPEGLHGIFANVTALGSFLGSRLSLAMEA